MTDPLCSLKQVAGCGYQRGYVTLVAAAALVTLGRRSRARDAWSPQPRSSHSVQPIPSSTSAHTVMPSR